MVSQQATSNTISFIAAAGDSMHRRRNAIGDTMFALSQSLGLTAVCRFTLCLPSGLSLRLQKYGRFTEAETGRYISDLVGAFQELERKNIIHRDIKPSVNRPKLRSTRSSGVGAPSCSPRLCELTLL